MTRKLSIRTLTIYGLMAGMLLDPGASEARRGRPAAPAVALATDEGDGLIVVDGDCNGDPLCVERGWLEGLQGAAAEHRATQREAARRGRGRHRRGAAARPTPRVSTRQERIDRANERDRESNLAGRTGSGSVPRAIQSDLEEESGTHAARRPGADRYGGRRGANGETIYDFDDDTVIGERTGPDGEDITVRRSSRGQNCASQHLMPVLIRSTNDPTSFSRYSTEAPASAADVEVAYANMLKCLNDCLADEEALFIAQCENAGSLTIQEGGSSPSQLRSCSAQELHSAMITGDYYGSYRSARTGSCVREAIDEIQAYRRGVDLVFVFDVSTSMRSYSLRVVQDVARYVGQVVGSLPFEVRLILSSHVAGYPATVLNSRSPRLIAETQQAVQAMFNTRVTRAVHTETMLDGLVANVPQHLRSTSDVVIFVLTDTWDQSFWPGGYGPHQPGTVDPAAYQIQRQRYAAWAQALQGMRQRVQGDIVLSAAQSAPGGGQLISDPLMESIVSATGGVRVQYVPATITQSIQGRIQTAAARRVNGNMAVTLPVQPDEILLVQMNGRNLPARQWRSNGAQVQILIPEAQIPTDANFMVRYRVEPEAAAPPNAPTNGNNAAAGPSAAEAAAQQALREELTRVWISPADEILAYLEEQTPARLNQIFAQISPRRMGVLARRLAEEAPEVVAALNALGAVLERSRSVASGECEGLASVGTSLAALDQTADPIVHAIVGAAKGKLLDGLMSCAASGGDIIDEATRGIPPAATP